MENVIRLYDDEPVIQTGDKVIVRQKTKTGDGRRYTVIDIEILQKAMRQLSSEGLKLWMFLRTFALGWKISLNEEQLVKNGINSQESFDAAIQELIDKKYLSYVADDWCFVEDNAFKIVENENYIGNRK